MSHDHPTIHYEDLSGDVCREIRCKEPDNSSNVTRRPESFEWYLLRQRYACFGRHRCGHVGLDETRRHDIGENVSRRELFRHRLRETNEPRLARCVVRLTLVADD